MNEHAEIVAIANCGLLIKSQQAKLLIDGIYQWNIEGEEPHINIDLLRKKDLFNPIPDEILNSIVNGLGEFRDIDGLLFTHTHEDHFSSDKTMECLEKNNIGSIFLPRDENPGVAMVRQQAKKCGVRLFNMNSPLGVAEEQVIKDIRIKYFKSMHSGKEYSYVAHYCFLININGKKIYISGDADYKDEYQHKMLEGEDIAVGFFNPLPFYLRVGRSLIKRINPRRVIMYHVPFAQDDKYGFREMSQRIMNRFRDHLPPCEIVTKELQTILI